MSRNLNLEMMIKGGSMNGYYIVGLLVAGIAALCLWCLCRSSARREDMWNKFCYPDIKDVEDGE